NTVSGEAPVASEIDTAGHCQQRTGPADDAVGEKRMPRFPTRACPARGALAVPVMIEVIKVAARKHLIAARGDILHVVLIATEPDGWRGGVVGIQGPRIVKGKPLRAIPAGDPSG